MTDFLEQLRDDHHNFEKGELGVDVPENPFLFFEKWYAEAFKVEKAANAMSVSTVNTEGSPSSRIVYLKEIAAEEFVFYTNYNSHKGQDLAHNPKIACLFFWSELERQVRIEGIVEKVAEIESDAYFQSRPRDSKIGAWVSQQSQPLSSREELAEKIQYYQEKFPTEVPRPPHWGGYAVIAHKIEFWQGRPSRLHDRVVYEKVEGVWKNYRINP